MCIRDRDEHSLIAAIRRSLNQPLCGHRSTLASLRSQLVNAFSAIRPSSNNPKDSKVVKLLGTSEPLGDGKIEQHFQLDRRPFSSIPDTEEYFAAATIENARSSIVRQILREEGPAFVVGTVGIGKTLLSHLLEDALIHHCRVIKMTSGRLSTRRALLQVMLLSLIHISEPTRPY